jgi:membrane associated rhomboid family serine protease
MFASLPPVTRAIIIANIVVFLLQQVAQNVFLALFALWPVSDPLFQPWQLLTYAFLHEGRLARLDITHIFFNMFALFMCVLTAGATELMVQNATQTGGPVIGASGGVFGLLLAFAWYFPRQKLILIPIPIPMPAWLFVTLYGVLELVLGVTGAEAGVAHFAHLGGMLGGALSILYWRMRGRFSGY